MASELAADLNPEALMPVDAVLKAASQAKAEGASRFCMGAAWRSPKDRDIERVVEMVRGVKALGMETCVTLGMLTDKQTQALKDGGLDYYNHNLDSSDDYYSEIITTDKQKGLTLKSMKEWETRLPDAYFCRIHRSTIINMEYIDRLEEWFNYSYRVYLKGIEKPLVMSRRYVARVKKRLG